QGIHMVIHLDPVITDDPKTNELKDKVAQIISQISPDISMHDFRVVWGVSHSNLIFDVVVPFNFQWSDDELNRMISDRICQLDSRYYSVITIDHSYVPEE
ncbi:MAG TPA: cation-efflux pump, partial [Bacillota bacterium]|nr:cation-efflux pump [Bacillota bacterium]